MGNITDIGAQLYVSPSCRAKVVRHLAEHGTVSSREVPLYRRDGSVMWASLNMRTVSDDQGTVLYYEGIIDDITTRKHTEKQLRESEARFREELHQQRAMLCQSAKVATMGHLLAGVSHELNNPLSVVLGQAALLCELHPSPDITVRTQKIIQAAERCVRIVKNFLALARQRPPERQGVQLNQVIQEAVELLAYQLRVDDVEGCLRLADDLPALWADRDQLYQVVVNLISNAQQAMHNTPVPRRLTITTRSDPVLAHVALEVADTGPGVPLALQQRIFEPFFTTKPPGVGTGLGLSLCHGIVIAHGGTIRVESRPGAGAIFVVHLPITMARGAIPVVCTLEPLSALAGKKILVVDDEPEIADLLREILSVDGHQVEIAAHGVIALEKLREQTYDLIMSDLRMPRLDGPGLYRELEQHYPELCRGLIGITGDMLSLELQAFLERTAVPTVSKPFSWEEVRRVVQQVLQTWGEGRE
jgi:signal transduction histidine kinase/CheY-like chemotaxis protein